MALSPEAPTPSDPGIERWPFFCFVVLPFDRKAVIVDETELILASSIRFEVEEWRSMGLLVAAPAKTTFYVPSRLDRNFQKTEQPDPEAISVFPTRISRNPRRNYVGVDDRYEIQYYNATGDKLSAEGYLIVVLRSKKPIKRETIDIPEDLAEELRLRRERSKTPEIVLP